MTPSVREPAGGSGQVVECCGQTEPALFRLLADPRSRVEIRCGIADEDPDELRALLGQPAEGHLKARPISTAVNNVRNNGPQLLDEPPRTTGSSPGKRSSAAGTRS